MKFSILSLVTLLPLAIMADPRPFDGNSRCQVQGFKVSFSKINECCLTNMGGSDFKRNTLFCTLPIHNEGPFRKCVKDLGYATVVDCEYYDELFETDPSE
ncbi:hypothetical protein BGZ46_010705 [Entomortierella lignicola]|nr:hypothetical protein BGZ46_010705 [Entomortierella lignicola]